MSIGAVFISEFMKHSIIMLASFLFCVFAYAQGPQVLIPVPDEVSVKEGVYNFKSKPKVRARIDASAFASEEAYRMDITPAGVRIVAGGAAGEFYALQSLAQMTSDGRIKQLQCCSIEDSPRFPYRGLHVDVSRHFRSVDFLKKQMDAMALFKMNRMHIHLTDAAGWRLKIEAYPLLTDYAAWRPQHTWKEWWNGDRRYCNASDEGAYGGYYTKEDIAEIVEYAAQRHIEVIPEIELPSHSEEVLAAYPHLGCSGEPYKDSDFCVGNEEVFVFLETVLSEVMEMFPSKYIHIGGDEASKKHWQTCPKCQERMRQEGIADVDGLQSYMIHRVADFIESRGRKAIGWDEILDGGLAPGAAVMSWRGTEGGIKAMSLGHDVVMSPGRYCYLDHTQDAPFREPESIGGYLPLDTVYVYEPVEPSMPQDKLSHLLGVQANLWSEYVVTDEHAEYMYWPRAFALAETGWSRPENKNLADFRVRALQALELLHARGYTTFDLANECGERPEALKVHEHLAKDKSVTYHVPFPRYYPAAGEATLTDGIMGGWTYSDGCWQGYLSDVDVTIDLGSVQSVGYIGATFMQLAGPGVFMPTDAQMYVSVDGQEFTLVGESVNDIPVEREELLFRTFETSCDVQARYVRYHAKRGPQRGFVFVDEIVIR